MSEDQADVLLLEELVPDDSEGSGEGAAEEENEVGCQLEPRFSDF